MPTAVPNTATFSMQDVRTSLSSFGSNPSTNLSTLLSQGTTLDTAGTATFDPTYEGSRNSLLNFRNFGANEA